MILVIDSTDRDRVHLSKEELWKLLNNEELARASILIYANKQDCAGCMTAAEVSSELNLTAIKQHKWQIQACVALTGQGLYQGTVLQTKMNSIIIFLSIKLDLLIKTFSLQASNGSLSS